MNQVDRWGKNVLEWMIQHSDNERDPQVLKYFVREGCELRGFNLRQFREIQLEVCAGLVANKMVLA